MIKITSTLKQASGFSSTKSVMELTSYTVTETVQLVVLPTMPAAIPNSKNIQINFSLYKSIEDKEAGAASYQAVDFPYNFSLQASTDATIDEAFLYSEVSAKLTELNYSNTII